MSGGGRRQVASASASVVSIAIMAVSSENPDPPSGQPDWSRMLQRAATGDHAALAELYDATSHLVFGLALRILGDREAAEDTVVEVYTQAWKDAPTYDPQRGTPAA